jgi:dCMP deaminase
MQLAFRETLNTDDPKARTVKRSAVAAVLVKDGAVLAQSANVLPPIIKEALGSNRIEFTSGSRLHLIEHAERAVLFKAFIQHVEIAGATMYCTRFPCSACSRALIWSGITRLVVPTGFREETDWIEDQRFSLKILRLAKVKIRYLGQLSTADAIPLT